MAALCDVNVLLALVTDRHAHHGIVRAWLDEVAPGEARICRLGQLGLLRLLNNPAVMREDVLDAGTCWSLWSRLLEDDRFQSMFEEPPGLDTAMENMLPNQQYTPRLWTDAYLASFALAGGLTLVTLDRGFRRFSGLSLNLLEPVPR